MKKIITLTSVALLLFSLNAMSQGFFTVKGSIEGVEDGKVILQKRGAEKFVTGLSDGQFMFKGTIGEPGLYNLTVEGIRAGISLFLQNTEFEVQGVKTNNGRMDVLEAKKITGGKAQEVWQAYEDHMAKAMEVFTEETKAVAEAYQAKDEKKIKELEPVLNAAYEKRGTAEMDFILENKGCLVGAYLMYRNAYKVDDPAVLEEFLDGMNPKMAETSYVKNIKETLEVKKLTAIGQPAPDFTQNDPDGNPVSLSEFRGQFVLIDFWASWCGPCRKENPNVVEAYNKYKKRGFTVLGVSLDNPGHKDRWLKAIEDDGLTWTQVSDLQGWKNVVAGQYGIRSIPSNLLIDKKGKIIAKNLRGEKLQSELKRLLR